MRQFAMRDKFLGDPAAAAVLGPVLVCAHKEEEDD